MRTTLSNVRASRIPEALNVSPDDARLVQYVNEATERLLHRGLWWGSYGRYAITATSQLLTLPAELDTIEAVAVSQIQMPVRDVFYEFLSNGWPTRDDTQPCGSGIEEVIYRGNFPTFVDLTADSVVTLICDLASDATKIVTVMGYDENDNWVRSLVDGEYVNGEQVALAAGAGTASTTTFSRITDIQVAEDLDGPWWLYAGVTLLASYQYLGA